MVKTIVFDLGGVIFKSDGWSFETREELSTKLGVDSRAFQDFWFERKDSLITGKLSEDKYLEELISFFKLTFNLEEFKQLIRSNNIVDEEMLQILELLKKKYDLFALTNDVREWIKYRIDTFNLNNYFNFIFSSSDLGLAKPDKEIYQHMVRKLNLLPEDILFIDNREENLTPAKELGMKVFHFKHREGFKEWLSQENLL